MAKTDAENFADYIQQSIYENHQFVEDVEGAILANLPGGRASVNLDSECEIISYDDVAKTVTLEFPFTGEFETHDVEPNGNVRVRANFTGRGKEHAFLEFVELLHYSDDLSE
jgi:hypothetical protein